MSEIQNILYFGQHGKFDTLDCSRRLGPKIVTIGGGTGLSTMLRGLKRYTENLTAVVTMADDGGSSGYLRTELGILPPGDIRSCITALANAEPTMLDLLNYRFVDGGLKGQSFGNLFLAALNGIYGSFEEAVTKMNEVLAVTGRVMPVTLSDVNLEALFEDGSRIRGESKIFSHKKNHKCRICRVKLNPERPPALKEALQAIKEADIIILGPGSLYTSIIPNLLVDGISEALKNTSALRLYILNIMTQDGETEGYTAHDHIEALFTHSDSGIVDAMIYNNALIDKARLKKYQTEDAEPVTMDSCSLQELECFGYPLITGSGELARHDPELLARAIYSVFVKKCHRTGIKGIYDQTILEQLNLE